jgi:ATP-binding cassette subfamily B protein
MERVRGAILQEQLSQVQIGNCWLLRFAPNAQMWQQVRWARLPRDMVTFLAIHMVQYVLFIASWVFVGRAVLTDSIETGWLYGWALLLLTLIPLQLWERWSQSKLAIGAGGLLKRRLLYGALRLQPDEVRHQGAGQFLGQVMESEAVEMLALGGGFSAILAVFELALAMWVLSQGAGGIAHSMLLLAWVLFALVLGWIHYRRSQAWVKAHLTMTDDLVERMVGHRTRLAQESPEAWHDMEDQLLAQYLGQTARRDQVGVQINSLIPRGWLILGLAGIVYAYLTGSSEPAALAISLGGILLASQALNSLIAGYSSLTGAALAWEQVSTIYQAADRAVEDTELSSVFLIDDVEKQFRQGTPILAARDLSFRFQQRSLPVLRGCNLNIYQGDRMLLEGPSGGGKSTLASVLIGLRVPESGLLLLHGLDRHSVGSQAWRQRVVAAPQFHENYVLTGTIAFNLLMGRRWPAQPDDLGEAEQVCRELGLDEVLSRMPSGLQQMVGEGGWQLSNGERSRLYIARALLQKADMIILDESFAALDPINLRRALECVLRRAPTLMVIAHP